MPSKIIEDECKALTFQCVACGTFSLERERTRKNGAHWMDRVCNECGHDHGKRWIFKPLVYEFEGEIPFFTYASNEQLLPLLRYIWFDDDWDDQVFFKYEMKTLTNISAWLSEVESDPEKLKRIYDLAAELDRAEKLQRKLQ